MDESYDLLLSTGKDGRITLVARDNAGKLVFEGPYTSFEERAKVPKEIWLCIRLSSIKPQLNLHLDDDVRRWQEMKVQISRILTLQRQLHAAREADPLGLRTESVDPSDRDNAICVAADALAKSLLNYHATDADKARAITEFHKERAKLSTDIETAQANLNKLSSVHDEGVFVHLGILP